MAMHMRRAMELADEAGAAGDVPIGAVLLVDDRTFSPFAPRPQRWAAGASAARST
jgi:tRNA(Arg) A34 adenosine deaminase TadA